MRTLPPAEECPSDARLSTIPASPEKAYKHEGWQGYGHWLGTGKVGFKKDHQFLAFKKALLHARSLKLKTQKEWEALKKCVHNSVVPTDIDIDGAHTKVEFFNAQIKCFGEKDVMNEIKK